MEEENFLHVYFCDISSKSQFCTNNKLSLLFAQNFKIDEIPSNIFFEDSEKLKYIKISSYENDLLDKNLRKKIFLYFLKMELPSLSLVKYDKRTYKLSMNYLASTTWNYHYVKKKLCKINFYQKSFTKK
jgi:hypothetical protein